VTGALVAALAAVAASVAAGAGLGRAAGVREWRGWMPALGLAGLFVLLLGAVRLPGQGATAALVALIAAAAGVWLGREALRGVPWLELVVVTAGLLLLAAVPFLVGGRFGPLGQSVNNDLAFHMTWADWLGVGRSFDSSGYPLGPHSLVAALGRLPGVDVEQAFAGLLMAVPALTGVCALDLVRDLPVRLRVLTALLAGAPYLAVSYYAQASFKEPQVALFFLAAVAALRDGGRRVTAVSLGVLGAGSLACFSAAGLGWVAVAAVAALLVRRGGRVGRRAWIAMGVLVLVGVLVTVPTGFFDDGPGRYLFDSGAGPGGNFKGELNPVEVLGVWPSPDFQAARSGAGWVAALAVAVLAGLAGAWLWRRREDPLPLVALLLSLALAAVTAAVTIPYISAKALVAAAPLLMVVVAGGLLSARPRSRFRAAAWALGCAVFVALAAHSSLLALRGAAVTPPGAGDELSALGEQARGRPTLFLGKEPYAPWYLREARLTTVPRVVPYGAAPGVFPRRGKRPGPEGGPSDFDSPPDSALAATQFVVTPRTQYASRPPASFRLVRAGRRYLLFERTGPVTPRGVVGEGAAPGRLVRCGGRVPPRELDASVRGVPVVAPARGWRQLDGAPLAVEGPEAVLPPTFTARNALRLPPGRWSVALSYRARFDTTAKLDGRSVGLPAFLGDRFAQLELGEVEGGREVPVEATAAYRSRGVANVASFLGAVTAVPAGERSRLIPLTHACGRYVDFVIPRG
jgi:hypothetical protein